MHVPLAVHSICTTPCNPAPPPHDTQLSGAHVACWWAGAPSYRLTLDSMSSQALVEELKQLAEKLLQGFSSP